MSLSVRAVASRLNSRDRTRDSRAVAQVSFDRNIGDDGILFSRIRLSGRCSLPSGIAGATDRLADRPRVAHVGGGRRRGSLGVWARSAVAGVAVLALVVMMVVTSSTTVAFGQSAARPSDAVGAPSLAKAPAALRSAVARDLGSGPGGGIQLRATYTSGGARFVGAGFTFGVAAGSFGRAGSSRAVAGERVRGSGEVTYGDGAMTESFRATQAGIEQTFVVATPPAGPGPLVIDVPVSGLLATTSGGAIDLRDAHNAIRARYSGLQVTDGSGRVVAASMRAISHGHTIAIEIADAPAEYPLTVDPTWSQVNELTASDGAAADSAGMSVAVSGPTAVVGAPFHTVSGHTDQGAATCSR
jgi:hypothetical protein